MLLDSDEGLAERVRQGDQAAFTQLVLRHQQSVYSLCYRMAGDATEAEDLAQEAFLRLYRSMGSFKPGGRLRPWLHRITANVCLDALRRRKAPTLPLEELIEGESHPRVSSRDELPEDALLGREARGRVQEALLQLPCDYRVALVLRYLEELTYREVADALGAPVSTVETRLFRARKMLGQVLISLGEGRIEEACP